ncbi:MAG: hypothetical protein U0521_20225 [Anaerolineae bacterium]
MKKKRTRKRRSRAEIVVSDDRSAALHQGQPVEVVGDDPARLGLDQQRAGQRAALAALGVGIQRRFDLPGDRHALSRQRVG